MSTVAVVLDWVLAARRPAMPAPSGLGPAPEPGPDVVVVSLPATGTCTCGCVALRVRNAHLEDKVARLTQILAGGEPLAPSPWR